jgi:hypothetical protein
MRRGMPPPHQLFEDCFMHLMWVNALHYGWRLLRDRKVHAPRVTAAEGLRVAWLG